MARRGSLYKYVKDGELDSKSRKFLMGLGGAALAGNFVRTRLDKKRNFRDLRG